jgi:carbamoyl-phosphate synthase large subunit
VCVLPLGTEGALCQNPARMRPTVVVLGSGPIRIGQGIEFDYSCVHCVYALRKAGIRAVIVNNNPETVSTDFDTGDALYFEPVTARDVESIVRREQASGVMLQFGGQTAINLADELEARGVPILGTSAEAIALAEDRERFEAVLDRLGIARPRGRAVLSLPAALEAASAVGYPVLVRPSFVLGGRGMEIVQDESGLEGYYDEAALANPGKPVLVDRYIEGTEAELDVISDGETTVVPGVMEHIERAGIHSGDSMNVYPPVGIGRAAQADMARIATTIARELGVRGLMNVQFVLEDGEPQVLEVNPRASRTVPYISKVTGVPMVALATHAALGGSLREAGYAGGIWCPCPPDGRAGPADGPWAPGVPGACVPIEEFAQGEGPFTRCYAVKAPVFSFQKLGKVEPALGPEMKSTGEVLGLDATYGAALYKALAASGVAFRPRGQVILTVADRDKAEAVGIGRTLAAAGHSLAATAGTHAALAAAGVPCELLNKVQEGSPNLLERLYQGEVSLMINTPKTGEGATEDSRRIRRTCIETGVACVTSIDTARALAEAIEAFADPSRTVCATVSEHVAGRRASAAAPLKVW